MTWPPDSAHWAEARGGSVRYRQAMQILLVRHGLPDRVDPTAQAVAADPGLTAIGRKQAHRVLAAVDGLGVSSIISSPMARAVQTGEPLAAHLGLAITTDPDLAEYDFGLPAYIPIHEAKAAAPEAYQRILAGHLPDFVDEAAFAARVRAGMRRVIDAHEHHQTVAVFCHGGVVNVWLQHLLGLDRPLVFPIDYTSVTRVLVSRDGRTRVASVNETAHVRDLLVRP